MIHRDLKPGNIKVKPDGTVKVLDFGLAKVGVAAPASDNTPTVLAHDTLAGVILGTAAYMSPEQAKGRPVDKNTDIWAFGVVLYEMLTGKQLHQGETVSETIASVLKEAPDLNRVPSRVRRLLRSCLQKDPEQRLHDIADWRLLLDDDVVEAPGRDASRHALAVAGGRGAAARCLGRIGHHATPQNTAAGARSAHRRSRSPKASRSIQARRPRSRRTESGSHSQR